MYNEPIFPWSSLSEAVEQIGLKETTSATGQQLLKAANIGDRFADEIVQARYEALICAWTGS